MSSSQEPTPIIGEDRIFNALPERWDKLASTKARLESFNAKDNQPRALMKCLNEELGATRPTVISIFNFKGGVGKTTVAVNVAGMLADLNKRVLVVDCDPQCNLTSFFMPTSDGSDGSAMGNSAAAAQGTVHPQDVVRIGTREALESLSSLDQGEFAERGITDVHACLKKLGAGMNKLEPPKKYYQPIPSNDRLLIIPGSSRLYDFDAQLNKQTGLDGELSYKTALRTLLRQAAYVTNADFVLVDCGPSSSMLNKIILISSDFILPPTFCDYFSLASMNSFLGSLLPSMLETVGSLRAKQGAECNEVYGLQLAYGFEVPMAPPKVLPFVATNYKVKDIADPNYIKLIKTPGRKRKSGASAVGDGDGDGDGGGGQTDHLLSRFVVSGHASFILSMRRLCRSPSLNPQVLELLCSDVGTMVIPLIKQTSKIIIHAQEKGMPAVIVDCDGITQLLLEKEYMRSRFTALCKFIISKSNV